jgi:hypothetical protein
MLSTLGDDLCRHGFSKEMGMKVGWKSASVFLVALALIGSGSGCQPAVPADWVKVNANDAFFFMAPPDLKPKPVQGIDSYVGDFESPTMHIGFDFGQGSADPGNEPGRRVRWRIIDGHFATVVTYEDSRAGEKNRFEAAVYFKNLAPTNIAPWGLKLTMWIYCKDAEAQEAALLIIQSLTFPDYGKMLADSTRSAGTKPSPRPSP